MSRAREFIRAEVTRGVPNWESLRILGIALFGGGSARAILLYRLGKELHVAGFGRMASLFFRKLQTDYGIYISPKAEVAIGLKLPHPTGIVIGEGAILGRNVTIFQQVTIGGARIGEGAREGYPRIGDDTVLFAGAKLIGNITVGRSCLIGANAVVNENIPDNSTAVGVPAKVVVKRDE